MNKAIKDIFNNIKSRFLDYDNEKKDYSFSIDILYDKEPNETKHTIKKSGAEMFEQRFEDAIHFTPKPDTIVIREYDGEDDNAIERNDFQQKIRIRPAKRTATKKKENGLSGLGELFDAKVNEMQQRFDIDSLKRDHEVALAALKKQITDLEEDNTYLNTELESADKRAAQLEKDVETAKNEKFNIQGIPLGKVAADFATQFLTRKPGALSGFGIPAETVKKALGEGGEQPESNQYDEPMAIIRGFVESLSPEDFQLFWGIVNSFHTDNSKIKEVSELLTEK